MLCDVVSLNIWAKLAYMKSFIIASSMLFIGIASMFTQSEMNLTFNAPDKVRSGESFILDVDVDKGDISTYAKLQLDLPEGFTAELLEGEGGTFTFYDQTLKLIWIALPSQPKFNIKFKINTPNEVAGKFSFSGKVSYVMDGARKSIELTTPEFMVDPNVSTTAPITAAAGTTGTSLSVKSDDEGASISVKRSIKETQVQPGGNFLVELKVEKNMVSGVGKIIENIPEGFTASSVENNGAIFSQNGNQVKFLWAVLPAEDEFTVSYKVHVDESVSGNKVLDGNMSYLQGSDTRKHLIPSSAIEISGGTVATLDPVTSPTVADEPAADVASDVAAVDADEPAEDASDDIADQTSTDVNDQTTAGANTNEAEAEGTTDADNDVATTSNAHQVNYRVQICALRKKKSTDYFVTNHNVSEQIYLSMHEGWHKYTVGDFKAYKNARDHREVVKAKNKIKGPFVTAYNAGTRITVQEALMITKDQWFQ